MSTPSPWDHLKDITPEMLDGAVAAIRQAQTEVQRGYIDRLEAMVLRAGHIESCTAYWSGPCSCGLAELQEDIIRAHSSEPTKESVDRLAGPSPLPPEDPAVDDRREPSC
jgi:hypothetical protein